MCGRVTLTVEPDEIARWLRIASVPVFQPRYNIAPTQCTTIMRIAVASGRREAVAARWGFVPGWATDLSVGNKMINARSETAFQKASFRDAMRSRRCLVPVSGFYEWKTYDKGGGSRPFLITMKDGSPFVLAGIWERNELVPQGPVETFSILTTAANGLMQSLHERMPVIVAADAVERWLNPGEDIRSLLAPYREDALRIVPVSQHVNNPSNEGSQCAAPETLPTESARTADAPKKSRGGDAPGQGLLFE